MNTSDIHAGKKKRMPMDETLRLHRERFEQLSELNGTYIWEVDTEGRYLYVSDTVETVLGYRASELLGEFFYDFHPPEGRAELKNNALDLFSRQACFKGFENPVVAKNGEIRWFSTNGLPIFNEKGKFIAYRGMDTDITEKRNIERALRLAQKKAEAAHSVKASFLANMSHEILTPMTTVLGFLDLLENTGLTEEQASYTHTMKESAEKLRMLLDDLLDYAKIEAHQLKLEHVDFDLLELLETLSGRWAHSASDKGLELICQVAPRLPTHLHGDPFRLGQILNHLVTNAVKFTAKGQVIIDCRVVEETETDVSLRFHVEDTGVGIPGKRLPHLFDKFSQLEDHSPWQRTGAGLGLAICKHLTSLMDGDIGVESEPGEGSFFWFTVHLAKQANIVRSSPNVPENLKNTRVLVVDDNRTFCELLVNRLMSWGMRPSFAHDSSAALHQLEQALQNRDPFALMLIDLEMPGMDGYALGQSIRADHRFEDMNLLLLVPTGSKRAVNGQWGRHFNGQVFKPFRNTELLTHLTKAIPSP